MHKWFWKSWESPAQSMWGVQCYFAVLSCLMQAVVQHGGWPSLFLLEDSQLMGDFYSALWDVGRRAGAAVRRTSQGAELEEVHT